MTPVDILKGLSPYRSFIVGSVKREFQSKYSNSVLGAAWTVINPLAMILVYTVIFSQIMRAKLPGIDSAFAYSIYLCAGILTWGLFTEITLRSLNVFLEHANLIKKVSFPRICLPIIVLLSSGLNFCIIFGLFTGFLIISGTFPGWPFLALFPVLIIQILFAIGLGIILGTLNVFFRDTGHFFGIFLQFWFWLTPIVYPSTILPEMIRPLLLLNPMYPLINAYQTVLVNGQWPQWLSLIPIALLGVMICLFGMQLFRKRSSEMVDEL